MGVISPISGSIARDNNDLRASGALAYFYIGGTTTPLTVYQDSDEGTPHAFPVVADGNGRWPAVFIPFTTSYDLRVTTSGGTELFYYTEIPNPDPIEATGTIITDAELWQTGDVVWRPVNTTKDGFVRLNGRTISSAAGAGTERANDDTTDLFAFLWNNMADGQAAVSGGRGASAAADFAANKTIALPDLRGSSPLGADDMGNSAASRLTGTTFSSGNATTAGSTGGANTHTLSTAELAGHTHNSGTLNITASGGHTHTGTTNTTGSGHNHTITDTHTHAFQDDATAFGAAAGAGANVITASRTGNFSTGGTNSGSILVASTDGTHTHTFTSDSNTHTHASGNFAGATASSGSDTAHNNVARSIIGTWFIKL